MKAAQKVPVSDGTSKEFKVSSLVEELRDRLGEAGALLGAVSGIAGSTDITRPSLERLRHVVIAAEGALGEAAEIVGELYGLVTR